MNPKTSRPELAGAGESLPGTSNPFDLPAGNTPTPRMKEELSPLSKFLIKTVLFRTSDWIIGRIGETFNYFCFFLICPLKGQGRLDTGPSFLYI
jgi:hypothetical protein